MSTLQSKLKTDNGPIPTVGDSFFSFLVHRRIVLSLHVIHGPKQLHSLTRTWRKNTCRVSEEEASL